MNDEIFFGFKQDIRPFLRKTGPISLIIRIFSNSEVRMREPSRKKLNRLSRALEHMPQDKQVRFFENLLDAWLKPGLQSKAHEQVNAELRGLLGNEITSFIGAEVFFILTADKKTLACMFELPQYVRRDQIWSRRGFLFELIAERPSQLEPFRSRLLPKKAGKKIVTGAILYTFW